MFMHKMILLGFVANCLGFAMGSFDVSYNLQQDELSNTYFFEVYMGSHLEKRFLLIYTLANGTAIEYSALNSKRATVHDEWVETISTSRVGNFKTRAVDDLFCLDDDEDICVENFTFF